MHAIQPGAALWGEDTSAHGLPEPRYEKRPLSDARRNEHWAEDPRASGREARMRQDRMIGP
jgi:hypothetical protein